MVVLIIAFRLACIFIYSSLALAYNYGAVVKNSSANAGDARDVDSIPLSGKSPGAGHGNPLEYSCLGNPMDRGVWWATVHGVTELDTTE